MFKVSRPCTLLSGYYVDNKAYLLLSFIVAKAMVVMGVHTIIRLVIAICCCHLWRRHDWRHLCSKYHGHTHYYCCLGLSALVIHGNGSDGRYNRALYHLWFKVSRPYAIYYVLLRHRCEYTTGILEPHPSSRIPVVYECIRCLNSSSDHSVNSSVCYSCTMAARGLRGMREWRRYIDHEGGARVGL